MVNRVFGSLTANAALADYAEVTTAWNAGLCRTYDGPNRPGRLCGDVRHAAGRRGPKAKRRDARARGGANRRAGGRVSDALDRCAGAAESGGAATDSSFARGHNISASEEGGNPLVDSPAVRDHPFGDDAGRPSGRSGRTVPSGPFAAGADRGNHRLCRRFDGPPGDGPTPPAIDRRRLWPNAVRLGTDLVGRNATSTTCAGSSSWSPWAIRLASGPVCGRANSWRIVKKTKVEDPTATQVRVMTVHQAKGLEFDIVVLPELDGRLKGKPPELAVGRPRPIDPVEMVCRMTNDSVRALLPEKFQKIFEIWPREAVGESLCLLYVAMTRSVHALHILVAPTTATKPGGKPPAFPKTFAGILRSALAEGRPFEPGKVAYEHGDRAWDRAGRASRQAKRAAAAEPKPIQLRVSGKLRHWDRRSPSELEGGTRVRWPTCFGWARRGSARIAVARLAGADRMARRAAGRQGDAARGRRTRSPRDWTSNEELAAFWQTVVSGPIGKLLCRVGLRRSAIGWPVGRSRQAVGRKRARGWWSVANGGLPCARGTCWSADRSIGWSSGSRRTDRFWPPT